MVHLNKTVAGDAPHAADTGVAYHVENVESLFHTAFADQVRNVI